MTETSTTVPSRAFFASRGWRFAMMIGLTMVMFVPLVLISVVVEDRVSYRRDAIREVSDQWGGPISFSGPLIIVPVQRTRIQTVKDDDGTTRTESVRERGAPIVLRPERLDITASAATEVRKRGIFEVPVYASTLDMSFDFDTTRIRGVTGAQENILWDRAVLQIFLPASRSFSGAARLTVGGRDLDLEPGSEIDGFSGIHARLGDPREMSAFSLKMGLNGADRLLFSPEARQTNVTMTSDWAHPSFDGAFLPKSREIGPDGFTARWEIPHLARDAAQVSRGMEWTGLHFGARFYNPVDFYQQVQRAVKYGIMFIALTFLTVFLTERLSSRPVHAAQFVLIGIAQCVFFLLLLSVAEQIGFTPAYLLSGGATIGLIGLYGVRGLALGRGAWGLVGALGVLYGVLYLILRSTDYALLAGSVLAFIAVALVMLLTGREDWSATGGARPPALST